MQVTAEDDFLLLRSHMYISHRLIKAQIYHFLPTYDIIFFQF